MAGLVAAFVVSRVGFHAAGIRFDMSAFRGHPAFWQFLSFPLLKDHLLQSIWYLHSQPPIFNLATGLLIKLPSGLQAPVAEWIFMALGLVLVLATFLTLVELGVPDWAGLVITVLVMIDPAAILYENWYFYAYPTAAVLAVSALCCVRYLRSQRVAWGAGFFWCLTVVVLMNSSFQIEWLLVPVVGIIVLNRHRWRSVVVAAAVPLIVVVGWYAKDEVQFGSFTTSSWVGMNIAPSTTFSVPHAVVEELIAKGTLTPIAAVAQFSPVAAYVPHYVRVPRTGVPALDQRWSSSGTPNYDDIAYVKVSELYLHNDLAFIRAEPGHYAAVVSRAVRMSFVPTDQFYVFDGPHGSRSQIYTWARLYDALVLWQPVDDEVAGPQTELGHAPGAADVAYGTIAVYALTVFGVPLVCWRRRRDRAFVATLGFLWLSTVWLFVVTSLVELGENNRLRFEVGPLPVIAAAAVVAALIGDGWRSRRGAGPDTGPSSEGIRLREPVDSTA